MTLRHAPSDAPACDLDPRTKLAFQFAFAFAAFAHTDPRGLLLLTPVAVASLLAAGGGPSSLWTYRGFLPFLLGAPLLEALTLGPPWIVPADGVPAALASCRIALVLVVSAAYLRSTPVRESRAAVQRTLPGRAGTLLGVGVGAVLRFLPVLRADLSTMRSASRARLGEERGAVERVRLVGVGGLRRLLGRADGFALALRARCFAWNPTLPELSFGAVDAPALAAAVALLAWALI